MNDLHTLLDRAAGAQPAPTDAHHDLTRGRRALARTRRRRGATGLAGAAVAGVIGLGAVRVLQPDVVQPARAAESKSADGITFLAQPLAAGPYTFDATPAGWEVQGVRPSAVTIAPVGAADQHPDSFLGKLVIMFDGNPPDGEQVGVGGRIFWVAATDGDYTTIATSTLPGEPEGMVRIQFPSDTGWDRDTMITFLGSVHVGPNAELGVG